MKNLERRTVLPSIRNRDPHLWLSNLTIDHHSHHPLLPLRTRNTPFPQILPTIDPLPPTELPTGLQPDCLH